MRRAPIWWKRLLYVGAALAAVGVVAVGTWGLERFLASRPADGSWEEAISAAATAVLVLVTVVYVVFTRHLARAAQDQLDHVRAADSIAAARRAFAWWGAHGAPTMAAVSLLFAGQRDEVTDSFIDDVEAVSEMLAEAGRALYPLIAALPKSLSESATDAVIELQRADILMELLSSTFTQAIGRDSYGTPIMPTEEKLQESFAAVVEAIRSRSHDSTVFPASWDELVEGAPFGQLQETMSQFVADLESWLFERRAA